MKTHMSNHGPRGKIKWDWSGRNVLPGPVRISSVLGQISGYRHVLWGPLTAYAIPRGAGAGAEPDGPLLSCRNRLWLAVISLMLACTHAEICSSLCSSMSSSVILFFQGLISAPRVTSLCTSSSKRVLHIPLLFLRHYA